MGTSYGGFVAYRMASMQPERVEKVVIASSAVNMVRSDNKELLQRAKVTEIDELMLPRTAEQLRKLTSLAVYRQLPMVPNFLWNDVVDVSDLSLIKCPVIFISFLPTKLQMVFKNIFLGQGTKMFFLFCF